MSNYTAYTLLLLISTSLLVIYYLANTGSGEAITIYTPPVLQPLVEEFTGVFEEKYSTRVEVITAPTGILLSKIDMTRRGDVLLTADHYYMEIAIERGFVEQDSIRVVSYVIPVIAFHRDTGLNVTRLEDLVYVDIEIAIGDPRVSPFGRIAVDILKHNDLYEVVEDRLVYFSDIGIAARQVALGKVKVGILPHVVKYWYPGVIEVAWIEPSRLNSSMSCQLIGVLKYSEKRGLAHIFLSEFTEYVSRLDVGRYGYVTKLSDLNYISPHDYTGLTLPVICRPG